MYYSFDYYNLKSDYKIFHFINHCFNNHLIEINLFNQFKNFNFYFDYFIIINILDFKIHFQIIKDLFIVFKYFNLINFH